MTQPPNNTNPEAAPENKVLRQQIFADCFRSRGRVFEKLFPIAKKPPSSEPICTGCRPLEPDSISKDDSAKSNNARHRVAK